jgi:hypothetical protein
MAGQVTAGGQQAPPRSGPGYRGDPAEVERHDVDIGDDQVPAGRQAVQDRPHQRLLQVDQRVIRLVIGRGLLPVAVHGADLGNLAALVQLGRGVLKQFPFLGNPGLHELPVMTIAGVRVQQGHALKAE